MRVHVSVAVCGLSAVVSSAASADPPQLRMELLPELPGMQSAALVVDRNANGLHVAGWSTSGPGVERASEPR